MPAPTRSQRSSPKTLSSTRARTIAADTIVLCAGQVERIELAAALRAIGVPVHVIGGAKRARELDAQRAIDEGVRLGAGV